MLTALLSAVQRTASGELRAGLQLAGRSVLSWQIDALRELGCGRILCLCEGPSDAILATQREVERAGIEFHAIRNNLQISTLIRADDDIVMLCDGLVIERDPVRALALDDEKLSRAIATLPSTHRLAEEFPADFQRIDRDRSWAGFALIRARQVQALADLPPDGDAMALLLRLALQAREPCLNLDDKLPDGAVWLLANDAAALGEHERALIASTLEGQSDAALSTRLATALVRRMAPGWIDHGAVGTAAAATALLLGGIGLALYGFGVGGIILAMVGLFAAELCDAWGRLRAGLRSGGGIARFMRVLPGASLAGAAIVLVVAPGAAGVSLTQAGLPLIALGVATIAASGTGSRSAVFWRDRVLHQAIFALALGFDVLEQGLVLFSLLAIAQLMLQRRA